VRQIQQLLCHLQVAGFGCTILNQTGNGIRKLSSETSNTYIV